MEINLEDDAFFRGLSDVQFGDMEDSFLHFLAETSGGDLDKLQGNVEEGAQEMKEKILPVSELRKIQSDKPGMLFLQGAKLARHLDLNWTNTERTKKGDVQLQGISPLSPLSPCRWTAFHPEQLLIKDKMQSFSPFLNQHCKPPTQVPRGASTSPPVTPMNDIPSVIRRTPTSSEVLASAASFPSLGKKLDMGVVPNSSGDQFPGRAEEDVRFSSLKKQRGEVPHAVHYIPNRDTKVIVFQGFPFYTNEKSGHKDFCVDLRIPCSCSADYLWKVHLEKVEESQIYVYDGPVTKMGRPPMFLAKAKNPDGTFWLRRLLPKCESISIRELQRNLEESGGWAYRWVDGSPQGCGPGYYLHQLLSFPEIARADAVTPDSQSIGPPREARLENLDELEKGFLFDIGEKKFLDGTVTAVRKFSNGDLESWYLEVEAPSSDCGSSKRVRVVYETYKNRFVFFTKQHKVQLDILAGGMGNLLPKEHLLSLNHFLK